MGCLISVSWWYTVQGIMLKAPFFVPGGSGIGGKAKLSTEGYLSVLLGQTPHLYLKHCYLVDSFCHESANHIMQTKMCNAVINWLLE